VLAGEEAEQLLDVGEVEAGGQLVEDVDAVLLGHLRGQLEPLPLASISASSVRERTPSLTELRQCFDGERAPEGPART
jgi:hypothetical protein